MNNEYDRQYQALDEEEKEVIEQSGIRDVIMGLVDKLDNARQIRRVIREAISTILIRELV